jgi:hypothetical protein
VVEVAGHVASEGGIDDVLLVLALLLVLPADAEEVATVVKPLLPQVRDGFADDLSHVLDDDRVLLHEAAGEEAQFVDLRGCDEDLVEDRAVLQRHLRFCWQRHWVIAEVTLEVLEGDEGRLADVVLEGAAVGLGFVGQGGAVADFLVEFGGKLIATFFTPFAEVLGFGAVDAVLIIDGFANPRGIADGEALKGGGAKFAENTIFAPGETLVELGDFSHFVKDGHLIHQVGLQKVGEVVGFVEWLEDGETQELPQFLET